MSILQTGTGHCSYTAVLEPWYQYNWFCHHYWFSFLSASLKVDILSPFQLSADRHMDHRMLLLPIGLRQVVWGQQWQRCWWWWFYISKDKQTSDLSFWYGIKLGLRKISKMIASDLEFVTAITHRYHICKYFYIWHVDTWHWSYNDFLYSRRPQQ